MPISQEIPTISVLWPCTFVNAALLVRSYLFKSIHANDMEPINLGIFEWFGSELQLYDLFLFLSLCFRFLILLSDKTNRKIILA
jgi:hypothetical protein